MVFIRRKLYHLRQRKLLPVRVVGMFLLPPLDRRKLHRRRKLCHLRQRMLHWRRRKLLPVRTVGTLLLLLCRRD